MWPGGPVRQPYSYSVTGPHRLFKNSCIDREICWGEGMEDAGKSPGYPSERALDIPRKEPWISLGMGHRYPSERALDIPRKGPWISSERAPNITLKGPWISLGKDPGYLSERTLDILGKDFGISLGNVPGYPSTYYFSMPVTPLS